MTEQNARYQPIEGVVDLEVCAYETIMHFDPVTDTGSIVSNAARYLRVDEDYHPEMPPAPCGSIVDHTSDIISQVVGEPGMTDPVTGVDLSGVSVAGMMVLHKNWFDRRWNMQANAPPPDDQPAETPEPAELPEEATPEQEV